MSVCASAVLSAFLHQILQFSDAAPPHRVSRHYTTEKKENTTPNSAASQKIQFPPRQHGACAAKRTLDRKSQRLAFCQRIELQVLKNSFYPLSLAHSMKSPLMKCSPLTLALWLRFSALESYDCLFCPGGCI